MNVLYILVGLFIASAHAADGEKKNYDIFTLSNTFYGDFIDHEEVVFLKYYAPWCGHCQQLAPIFIELAKEMHGKLKFAEIDCDANREICDTEELQGFPTLALFRKGRAKKVYKGERTLNEMKNWIEEMLLPPMVETTLEKIEEMKQKKDYSFLVLKSEADDAIKKKLIEVEDYIDYLKMYTITTEMDNFEISVWNGERNIMFTYDVNTLEAFDQKKFVEWANLNTFPLFHHVNMPLIKRVDNMPLYMVWYFFQTSIPDVHKELFNKLALKYQGKFVFFHFNQAMSEEQVKSLHQSGNVYPCMSVIHKNKRNIYAMDDSIEINEENVVKYLDGILSKEILPTLRKSEPIKPEDQKGPLFKLTGHNFDEYINTPEKDTLIVFCADRAEVCKYFMSTPLKNVETRMKGIATFQMAWIDASTDDMIDEFNLDNIPKLYLISNKDGKRTDVEMTIMPSEENTMNFIFENAQFKFEMPAPLPEPEEKKEAKDGKEAKEAKEESTTSDSDSDKEEVKKEIKEEL